MTLSHPCPILRIFDVTKAMDHYVGFLGFKVDWEHRFSDSSPLYCQISKDGCILHLSEHYGDACPGASVRIQASDLKAYQTALLATGYNYFRPGIEKMPWGTLDMYVTDPFGNRITFWQEADKAD